MEVSIKGWDDDIFEMAGEYQLEEINRVAKAVGAQIAIKKVKTYRTLGPDHLSLEIFEMIAAIINQQEGGLDKLELTAVEVWQNCAVVQMSDGYFPDTYESKQRVDCSEFDLWPDRHRLNQGGNSESAGKESHLWANWQTHIACG